MKKENLLQSASSLNQPSAKALNEFSEKAETFAKIINEHFLQRHDLESLVGKDNAEMMCDNHRNHLRFMMSLFTHYEPQVLVETVLWVFRAYRSHGFKLTYWPAQLDNWVAIFRKELSADVFDEIYPFYHWMIVNNPAFAMLSDQAISEDTSFAVARHD